MKIKTTRLKLNYLFVVLITLSISCTNEQDNKKVNNKSRVIVTSDGEIDDECSMIRFLLYANEWDIEGIITSSSQYHWHGHNWAGDDWLDKYLEAYAEVYPNLLQHDEDYPSPEYLKSVALLGNVEAEGEMDSITDGSEHIVKILLDTTDNNPIWLQAWGGPNTISRALKTIQEDHPEMMEYVANKIRFFFIWEQDSTYQSYIRPNWGKYNIVTIISDQFEAIAYRWKNVQPEGMYQYFEGTWMKENILDNHGPLCSLYKAHDGNKDGFDDGDFRSEGDSPSFMHTIPTGLRNMESPDWGGWGGRYIRVRENTWLDPVPVADYEYPEGRWYTSSAWGRNKSRSGSTSSNDREYKEYFKPIWRWSDDFQNDFAARADWCVLPFDEANHPPEVRLDHPMDLFKTPGALVELSAKGTSDPDKDKLSYHWWFYQEASSYKGEVVIDDSNKQIASLTVPEDARIGTTLHIICEVQDSGVPKLTRYKRVIIVVGD